VVIRDLYLRYLSKNSTTVAHVGVYGFGFSTAQPFDDVDRRVAATCSAESVIIARQTPVPRGG